MNLTWHILRKDIGRLKWLLVAWAALGAYSLAFAKFGRLGLGEGDVDGILAFMAFVGLSLSLVAWIVQEDEVTQPGVFWRTRPISPIRLLSAKLILIGVVIVLLPSLGIAIARPRGLDPTAITFLATMALLGAAVAASVKDLGRYFLVGFLCFLLFGEFSRRLVSLGLHRLRVTTSQAHVLEAVWALAAILVLVVQYRGNGLWKSVGIVATAIVLSLGLIVMWQPVR